jgi:hypothetical protein
MEAFLVIDPLQKFSYAGAGFVEPMPPAPIRARISYGLSLSPTGSGIGAIYQVYSFLRRLTAALRASR